MASIKSLRLENLSADLDKHPGRWVKFQSDFSDMVRSMEHGDVLETFIDEVTGRNQYMLQALQMWTSVPLGNLCQSSPLHTVPCTQR